MHAITIAAHNVWFVYIGATHIVLLRHRYTVCSLRTGSYQAD